MKKKFLAIAMAAAMAFSTVSALPVNTTVAQAAEPTVINVDKQIGADDLTSAFWTEFGDNYKIEDGKSYTINFDVYGGAAVYNNCFMVLSNVAATSVAANPDYKEFGVIRMDSWGWSVGGNGGDNKTLSGDAMVFSNSLDPEGTKPEAWAQSMIDIMKKATVALNVTRNGKNISIEANVHAKEDASKSFIYKADVVAALEDGTATPDVYLTLGVDGSMIKPSVEEKVTTTDISETVGAEDYSTAFWKAVSKQYKIESDKTYVFDFENHGSVENVWNSYVTVFTNEAAYNEYGQSPDYYEYAVIRSDPWGWSTVGNNVSHNGNEIVYGGSRVGMNDDDYKAIVKDSNVSLTINRKGDLVSTEAVVTSIADPTKSYNYTTTFSLDSADAELYYGMTVDGSYLVMKTMSVKELSATMPENPKPAPSKPNNNGSKKQIMLSAVSAKLGAKKVTGTVNAPDATVKVQVNKAAAVTATVKDKKFTANLKSKLKAGDKVKITVTAEGYYEKDQTVTVKGTMKVSKVTAKKGAKTITGTVSEKKATVKIKVGKKAYKKAKVSGKKFTLKVAALKKGTKVTVKATKKNYKTATKSVKVK